jgi:hypothetical protein
MIYPGEGKEGEPKAGDYVLAAERVRAEAAASPHQSTAFDLARADKWEGQARTKQLPSTRLRHAMTKWPHHPNLRKKPHAPSKGRGPVQRAIRRAFMASGAEVLNSTDIYDWAHGRCRFGRRKSMPFGVYSRTLRTLRAMCEPVGRAPTIGRPWLWRLKHSETE